MQTTKEKYPDYIKNYPNELYTVQTPTYKSHIDAITGKTIATVAMEWMSDAGEVDEAGGERFWEYYIIDDNGI